MMGITRSKVIFFSLTPFCRDRSQVKELFYWSASRHWDCFYTGRQSPWTNQGGCGGSRLGCVGSGGSCARRSLRDGGSPSRLWWWVGSSKRRLAAKAVIAACVRKAVHLEMREVAAAWRKGAGVSRVLVRARLVMKEAASSLQRPPTSMPKTTRRHLELWRSSG